MGIFANQIIVGFWRICVCVLARRSVAGLCLCTGVFFVLFFIIER